ncbi:DUF4157 domain-containing protein [Paeniglutamicibacter antarcticus]|uniref:DUF4157 domain-containing protein n=1 Tax=Arthrobacter terrae TaxID=2935737 RepID=A0A931CL93_9MICC|nr:DUF4157 domain-containing protein [Arthrobacter terrae]MBG0737931.1 DUF4157 domain-containing protein [Arthrobacter terrae]
MTSFAVSGPQDAKEREAGKAADRLMHSSLGADSTAAAPQNSEVDAAAARSPTTLGNFQLSAGQSLDRRTRDLMEPKFGADFLGVQVHTEGNAIGAANALGAKAFTVGSDIGFAAGRYRPDSPTGQRLLAHELAHVVQNAGAGSSSTVYRDPVDPDAPFAGGFGGGQFGGGGAGRSFGGGSSGGGGASGSFAPPAPTPVSQPGPEVIELKGKPLLAPSPALAQAIKDKAGDTLLVHVRFGELAEGFLPIVWSDTGFMTPPPAKNFPAWGIPMTHPAFPVAGLAKPTLWIEVRDSVVGGAMGWITAAAWANDPSQFRSHVPLEMLFGGLSAFTNLKIDGPITDVLWNGRFSYEAPHLTFDSGPFSGSGRIRVSDENYDFDATIDVPLTGLPKGATVPVKRPNGLENLIFGSKTWRYERTLGGKSGSKISGELTATLGNGSFDVRGTAGYSRSNPRIRGTVTIVVGSLETARQAVTDRLGPDAPASIEPAAPGEGIAIAGFGQLDFELSEWMTGNAEVIVHPEGWVTARGEILPTKIIPLFRKQAKEREVPGAGGSLTEVVAGLPLIGDVRIEAEAQLYSYGWFGPGTLHDIRVTGLISNHPAIVNRFELAGTISSPAAAGLRLEANIGLSAYAVHLKKVAEAKLTGQGTLELQMYAEAAAAAGRRASTAPPGEAEYYLRGSLAAAAALILDLQLKLRGDVLGFWRPNIHLIDQTYTLGQAGAKLNFEYVFGKNKDSSIEVSFDKVSFDAGTFAAAVVRGETVTQKGYEGKTPVAADTTSEVVNPDAPPPPGPVASGAHTSAQLEEPFSMYWASHTLRLSLLEPPDLQMESTGPERLLNRISRARKNVRKDAALSVLERDTRLSDLDKIAAQARQVLDAAEKVEKGSRYLTPSVPGFHNLAQLIADYGTRYRTTDLAVGLAAVSVDPTNPKTVLNKFPKLADDALIAARVGRILDMGVSATVLRRIVDNHPPSAEGDVVDLLEYIETMILARAVNWGAVLTDLKIGGRKLQGATWVLRYIATYGDWSDVSFEAKDEDAGQPDNRRWDTLMSGTLYEFKDWYVWKSISSRTFLKQILQDYLNNGVGETMPLKWVFSDSPLTRKSIIANMEAALDGVKADLLAGKPPRVPGYYSPAMCDTIKSRLNSVVVKVN